MRCGRQSAYGCRHRHHEHLLPYNRKAADIISGGRAPDDNDGWTGLSSIITTEVEGESGKWLHELGWAIRDINGDNVLLIGIITNHIDGGQGNMIVALYNIRNGKARNLIDAGYRDAWYMMWPGDSFLELGAASASCSICAQYRYLPNETPQIACDHYNFTGLNEAGDHVFYHSYLPGADPEKPPDSTGNGRIGTSMKRISPTRQYIYS